MATTLYITVVGKGSSEAIKRYLGFGAEVEAIADADPEDRHSRAFALLRVTDDSEQRARSDARWNADRLASGLWATKVLDTRAEALDVLREFDCYI